MSKIGSKLKAQRARLKHHTRVRNALRELSPAEFTYYPEPPSPGDYATGLRFLNGEIFDENQIHTLSSQSIWDYSYPSEYFAERLHAFDWMDDLAAVKTVEAERKMRGLSQEWFKRYARGDGPGWREDLVAWRIIRLISHATTLLADNNGVASERFFESLGIQVSYLKQSVEDTPEGLPRIVSLVALLFASLALDRFHEDLDEALENLDAECSELVEQNEIYLYSRNPEELSQIFILLVWADQVAESKAMQIGKYHDNAMDVIGRVVRALRLTNRKLLSAHGGGFGDASEIDRALSTSQVIGTEHDKEVLGFRQIRAASLNAYFDCSAPPSGPDFCHAHASALAIWVAEKDQILLGAGGSRLNQPMRERIDAQQTYSHSTLALAGQSSCELTLKKDPTDGYTMGAIIERPLRVFDYKFQQDHKSIQLQASHDGYRDRFGYTHQRKLLMDRDGLYFGGLDILQTETPKDKKRAQSILGGRNSTGIPFEVYFHLGPNISPSLDMKGDSVSFESQMGHIWVFRQEGGRIEITDSQFFDENRLNPTPAKSIVVRTRLMDVSGYLTWSFQAFPKT